MKSAVVLVSGGLDSATVLGLAMRSYRCHALSFSYGQRHVVELEAAKCVVSQFKAAEHCVFPVALNNFGGSALTDPLVPVPIDGASAESVDPIPSTYVPARNTVFLSIALAFAESRGISDIFLGVNALDYSGYPDCRPEYLRAFEAVANLATKAGVNGQALRIHAPLLYMSKAEIVRLGTGLKVDYGVTVSCYQADDIGRACGQCDSCHLRAKGFESAGLPDPTRYQT